MHGFLNLSSTPKISRVTLPHKMRHTFRNARNALRGIIMKGRPANCGITEYNMLDARLKNY